MSIFGVNVGYVVLTVEMQLKIVKSVPSGGNRNVNEQKVEKCGEIVFFENLALCKWTLGVFKQQEIVKCDVP